MKKFELFVEQQLPRLGIRGFLKRRETLKIIDSLVCKVNEARYQMSDEELAYLFGNL